MLKFVSVFLFSFNLLQSVATAHQGIILADDYKKNSGLQWEWAMESLEKFPIQHTDNILDVGCGDGKITALIAENTSEGSVVGIDISENMISKAASQFKNNNLHFLQADATALPFKEQFDKIVSFCTLHWVVKQEQAIKSMKHSLKKGGVMLIVTPGKAANNIAALSEKIAHSEKWSAYFPAFKQERVYYTPEEYVVLLNKENLQIQSMVIKESVTIYKDKEALVDWLKPLINFIDVLPSELKPVFIEEIANQMLLNDPPFADGTIGIRHVKMEFVVVK